MLSQNISSNSTLNLYVWIPTSEVRQSTCWRISVLGGCYFLVFWKFFGKFYLFNYMGYRTQNLQACSKHHFLNDGQIAAENLDLFSIQLFSTENIAPPSKWVPILVGLKMWGVSRSISTTAAYIDSTPSRKASMSLDSIILLFGNALEALTVKEKMMPTPPPRGGRSAPMFNLSSITSENFPEEFEHRFRLRKPYI